MRDYLELGPTPCEEICLQVGDPNYSELAGDECRRYRDLIRKVLGPEPEGARLAVKTFPHDFGSYCEVVCWYDEDLPESIDYAFRCEGEAPTHWDQTEAKHNQPIPGRIDHARSNPLEDAGDCGCHQCEKGF